jgi:hypothetical protein
MPASRRSKRTLVPQARQALEQMKWEVASELNVPTHNIQGGYWGDMTSRDCGSVGGGMVRRMIEAAQASLAATTAAGVKHGFSEAVGPWATATGGAAHLNPLQSNLGVGASTPLNQSLNQSLNQPASHLGGNIPGPNWPGSTV